MPPRSTLRKRRNGCTNYSADEYGASPRKKIDGYRSVRDQLEMGKLKQKNKELEKQNGFLWSIIEQYGLGHILDDRKSQRQKQDRSW